MKFKDDTHAMLAFSRDILFFITAWLFLMIVGEDVISLYYLVVPIALAVVVIGLHLRIRNTYVNEACRALSTPRTGNNEKSD